MLVWHPSSREARAADTTHIVHESTLRYGVRRIPQRFGIHLANHHVRPVTWLELRLRPWHRGCGGAAPSGL
jgi:hypothetical protein